MREDRRTVVAALLLAAIVALGVHAGVALGGPIWNAHRNAGRLLLAGSVPAEPGYPMWGYSLLSGMLGEGVVWLQVALLFGLLATWLLPLLRAAVRVEVGEGRSHRRSWRLVAHPVVAIVVLSPWIWLATSWYSNAASALLAWLGSWSAIEAARRRRSAWWFGVPGLVLGLAANVRSETTLLAVFLAGGLIAQATALRRPLEGGLRALALLAGFATCMVPWLVYTGQTLGAARLTSTNGGAVLYLGLGTLPANPWRSEADDRHVHALAEEALGTHAWSAAADGWFRERFLEAVRAEPGAFVRRVLRGWRLALTQGVMAPPIENVWRAEPSDLALADFLNERAKQALGLAVNRRQLYSYQVAGFDFDDLAPRHYAMVATEYAMRGILLLVFLALLATSTLAAWRLGPRSVVTWVWLATLLAWLATAGVVQSLPRHTTSILPALYTAVVTALVRRSR